MVSGRWFDSSSKDYIIYMCFLLIEIGSPRSLRKDLGYTMPRREDEMRDARNVST